MLYQPRDKYLTSEIKSQLPYTRGFRDQNRVKRNFIAFNTIKCKDFIFTHAIYCKYEDFISASQILSWKPRLFPCTSSYQSPRFNSQQTRFYVVQTRYISFRDLVLGICDFILTDKIFYMHQDFILSTRFFPRNPTFCFWIRHIVFYNALQDFTSTNEIYHKNRVNNLKSHCLRFYLVKRYFSKILSRFYPVITTLSRVSDKILKADTGISAEARLMGVSTTKARYWDQKARDHTFHPDRHVFYMWRTEPALTDVQVVDFLREQGWTWDPSRLKYLDESRFENYDCSRWQYCRAPRGERVTRSRPHM
eukprot:g64557.t1